MIIARFVAAAITSAALVQKALSLDLSASHFSFGGVNYPQLASLEPEERDAVIHKIAQTNATVVRLFIAGDKLHSDVEPNLGVFDERTMKRYDDTLWSIYRIGKGKIKVIIAPHDINNLRGEDDALCDAYCRIVGGAWLDFYTNPEIRARYKMRLNFIFKHYVSKNFKGASWGELNDIILGVDLQNKPFKNVSPIPVGEGWLCDIADHLKNEIGLGKNNIAVISGGVSGSLSEAGEENMPEAVWKCDSIDVIGIHGAYSSSETTSAGTNWARRFLPGSAFPARALGKKLILVEEFSFVDWMHGMKAADIWDQAEALNFRGIPWLYANVREGAMKSVSEVRFRGTRRMPIGALTAALNKANKSPSLFDWGRYLRRPTIPTPHTSICPNPWKPYQDGCLFGCLGWLCDAMDGCRSDLICKNNVCEPCTIGCPGMACDGVKSHCQEPYQCMAGTCQACTSRSDLRELHGTCEPTNKMCSKEFFPTTAICNFCDKKTMSCRGAPCERASDCDWDEHCDWGLCKPCKEEGCLGMQCKSSMNCKTGFCNKFGRCDYAPKPAKLLSSQQQQPIGRRGPCGPGQDCNRRNAQPLKPQPVLLGNVHSRGAGEKAGKAGVTPTPTGTH